MQCEVKEISCDFHLLTRILFYSWLVRHPSPLSCRGWVEEHLSKIKLACASAQLAYVPNADFSHLSSHPEIITLPNFPSLHSFLCHWPPPSLLQPVALSPSTIFAIWAFNLLISPPEAPFHPYHMHTQAPMGPFPSCTSTPLFPVPSLRIWPWLHGWNGASDKITKPPVHLIISNYTLMPHMVASQRDLFGFDWMWVRAHMTILYGGGGVFKIDHWNDNMTKVIVHKKKWKLCHHCRMSFQTSMKNQYKKNSLIFSTLGLIFRDFP